MLNCVTNDYIIFNYQGRPHVTLATRPCIFSFTKHQPNSKTRHLLKFCFNIDPLSRLPAACYRQTIKLTNTEKIVVLSLCILKENFTRQSKRQL